MLSFVRTLLDERAKCRDSIQKLMRIIIAQGATISTQLAGLKEKEEAIDNFEERMHNLRMRESGRDYLLHTYLDQLPEVRLTHIGPLTLTRCITIFRPSPKTPTWR